MGKNEELRAAAERLMDYDIPTNDAELDMIARHILATVPADDAEPVTVKKLEEWGGEPSPPYLQDDPTSRRFRLSNGDYIRAIYCVGTWCVEHYVNGWRFLAVDRNTVGQMRQTLVGLGIKLKGGA